MAERTVLGIQKARDGFRTVVDDAFAREQATVIERHGVRVAAVVPYAWLEELDRLRDLHGDASRSSE